MEKLIKKLVRRYGTSNPYTLANELNIDIYFMPLGKVRGFYNNGYRRKAIYINNELPPHQQRFTAAHELGHALLHPRENTPFLRESTLFSVSKLETQANRFACMLLTYHLEQSDIALSVLAARAGIDEKVLARYL